MSRLRHLGKAATRAALLVLSATDSQRGRKMFERVCAAIIRDDAILMVHHRHGPHDYWTLPGGGIEPGESPTEAIIREVREEVGLQTRVARLLFESEFGIHKTKCFLLEVDGDQEPALGYDPELGPDAQIIQDMAWFPLASVRDDIQVSKVIESLSNTARGRE